jgi:hypothetical protein
MIRILFAISVAFTLFTHQVVHAAPLDDTPDRIRLETFLKAHLNEPNYGLDQSVNYSAVRIPDTNLVIVYLQGRLYCGSGGCELLVLRYRDTTFHLLSSISIVNLPVSYLSTKTNGLPDLAVMVRGGGIIPGYEAALPFDGTAYAENPSVPPARKVQSEEKHVLIPENDTGTPLYK